MPYIYFKLTKPRLSFDAGVKDGSGRELLFLATPVLRGPRAHAAITLVVGEKRIDGTKLKGSATITVEAPALSAPAATTEADASAIASATPAFAELSACIWDDADPWFEVNMSLGERDFERISDAVLTSDAPTVVVTLETELLFSKTPFGLHYGNDPDGHDVEWRFPPGDRQQLLARVESASLTITPARRPVGIRPDQIERVLSGLEDLRTSLGSRGPIDKGLRRLFWLCLVLGTLALFLLLAGV